MTCNKPLADVGLKSYRYAGVYGWVMIGAKDDNDALNEAKRSTGCLVENRKLQYWNGIKYCPVSPS